MKSDVTIRQLRALLAVIEARGFTRAASRLGASQAGISQSIAALEHALGAPLLVRRHGAVVPTPLGEVVAVEARVVVEGLERMRAAAAEAAGQWTGRLRLAASPGTAALVASLLRGFRRRHAEVQLSLLEGSDEEVCAWVRGREAELGITSCASAGLETLQVAEDELVLVLPALHRLSRAGPAELKEVSGEPFLLLAGGGEGPVREALDGAGVAVSVTMRVRDVPSLLALVREGLGLTILPELALPEPVQGVRVRHFTPPVRRRLDLVWSPEAPRSRLVADFVEQARPLVRV